MALTHRNRGSKWTGIFIQYRKIIAVCDNEVENQLRNAGWKALTLSKNNIKIIKVDIGKDDIEKIAEAQKRQYR